MTSEPTRNATAETVAGVSGVLVGIGAVTMALAPLALPILILLTVPALPLVAVAAAFGLVVLALRAAVRAVRRLGGGGRTAGTPARASAGRVGEASPGSAALRSSAGSA